MPTTFNPVGQRGSWFAEWRGESYPCIHTRYRTGERHQWYDDPSAKPGNQKWDELLRAVNTSKKVIETKDLVRADDMHRTAKRANYIGLWEIDDIIVTPNPDLEGCSHLRFRFAKRLA